MLQVAVGKWLERQLTVLNGELVVDFLPASARERNFLSPLFSVLGYLLLQKKAELLLAKAFPEPVDLVGVVEEVRGVGQDDLEGTRRAHVRHDRHDAFG